MAEPESSDNLSYDTIAIMMSVVVAMMGYFVRALTLHPLSGAVPGLCCAGVYVWVVCLVLSRHYLLSTTHAQMGCDIVVFNKTYILNVNSFAAYNAHVYNTDKVDI